MRAARGLALAMALWGAAAGAQAPGAVPRPQARPAPEAPARPLAREAATSGGATEPARMARAETAEPAPVQALDDAWAGDSPPVRPAAEPAVAEVPAPARPRARPLAPRDPAPLPVPAPDAPPAYAPGARPDLLAAAPAYSRQAVARALLPRLRPRGVVERVERARAEAVRGQVCGDPLIQGDVVAPVGGSGGCGIGEPVRIRSVDGVRLSEGALMDCPTAEALLDWVRDGARPAIGARGGGLAGIEVMGHYACRPMNNQAGARLSEHGRGRALDVGALRLADGSTLSVLRDWPDPALRAMHRAACGPFSTVLGPEADAQHRDHFHLDTARGRSPYCR